jgi:hypothetical protein
MPKAGSKKVAVAGATRVKNAIILSATDWRLSSIFLTQLLSDIFIPPQQV